MAQHGGKRPGAGRKPGRVSKAKRELADMAKDHAESALDVLAEIMHDNQQPAAARVSAANALLDRGYGKPAQAVQLTGAEGGPVTLVTRRVVDANGTGD
ncbi:hypothetical protein [Paracoccus sp. SY]|uniref:hypothetical protein n=1 Tax=Paracoccus sp. SY TaxID=1330255 RepID=UPI001960B3AD|nr:hypothetical protein [Paracoccus sp. SY]